MVLATATFAHAPALNAKRELLARHADEALQPAAAPVLSEDVPGLVHDVLRDLPTERSATTPASLVPPLVASVAALRVEDGSAPSLASRLEDGKPLWLEQLVHGAKPAPELLRVHRQTAFLTSVEIRAPACNR
eukprot:11406910-Alexandrium_andersonii.AAC.1